MIWYFGLTAIGIVLTVFIMYKKRKETSIVRLILFYLFTVSITYFGEFLALVVFEGYVYKPGIFMNPMADSVIGHLMINSTLWPGTALLVVTYSLGYGWITLITAGYILAEFLFVKLDIYDQHWWRYYMSVIVVFLFHAIARMWYKKLQHARSNIPRNITFYFAAKALISTPITVLLYLGLLNYRVGWVEDVFRDSVLFFVIYHLGMSFFYVLFVCGRRSLLLKLAPIPVFLLGDIILVKLNIQIFYGGWNLFYHTLVQTVSLLLFIALDKYTLKPRLNAYPQGNG